jgi:tRNA-splicing endonuclease subunit Sen15, fungi type
MADATPSKNSTAHDVSPSPLLPLAHQVAHNLQHQQRWTAITIHTTSLLTGEPLARPLVSGLPPRRVYVHPDEQVEMLRRARQKKQERKEKLAGRESVGSADAAGEPTPAGGSGSGSSSSNEAQAMWEPKPQREWVLPTDLREEWTLRRLAAVFAGIDAVPPRPHARGDEAEGVEDEEAESEAKWRTTKRLLLAAIQSDSTIVYYVVHDGIVKPRTN